MIDREIIEYFNSIIRDAEKYSIITRDINLQAAAIDRLHGLNQSVIDKKKDAIDCGDEECANLMLGYESVISCLTNEILMWIALKEQRPDDAWDNLVNAQLLALDAARAHEGFSHLIHKTSQLEVIEKVIFPPQTFVSAGLIVRRQRCSICGLEYGDCDHLVGMPYMGKFCFIWIDESELNHMALVDEPADKRCRALSVQTDEGNRNVMTWKVEP